MCAKLCNELFLSTANLSEEINTVPLVPKEMLHEPSKIVPVPIAAAALSPAPAETIAFGKLNFSLTLPTTSNPEHN